MLVAAVAGAGVLWALVDGAATLRGQSDSPIPPSETSSVFTPAHRSVGEAVRHFLMIRPDPVQPIPFPHNTHINDVELACTYCHQMVARGPVAQIPSVQVCMDCHSIIAVESPLIQELTAYFDRGQEPPWQRVYGWYEEAHVRFNHAPHIRAEVECATCHGDVAQMTVAERAVDHTMSFCIECHEQRQASNDCLVCHY